MIGDIVRLDAINPVAPQRYRSVENQLPAPAKRAVPIRPRREIGTLDTGLLQPLEIRVRNARIVDLVSIPRRIGQVLIHFYPIVETVFFPGIGRTSDKNLSLFFAHVILWIKASA